MTSDDDRLRQALSSGEPSFAAHEALQQLRPPMQRARLRRRVTVGVTTLSLLAVCGAGVLALAPAQTAPTLRTADSDDANLSVLPEPTTVPPAMRPPDVATAPPPVVVAPQENPAEVPTTDGATPPVTDDSPSPSAQTPTPTTPAPTLPPPPGAAPPPAEPTPPAEAPPTAVEPPATAAPAVFRTIATDCGDVLVSIENSALRIASVTARPGYVSEVSDDGPNSVEVVLRGDDETCELHGELKSGELDIEVQNPSKDD